VARPSSSPIVIGASLVGASLAVGGLGVFLLSRSAYRWARLEAILDEPSRIFGSYWLLQGGAMLVLITGLVGLALIVFGIRDRIAR